MSSILRKRGPSIHDMKAVYGQYGHGTALQCTAQWHIAGRVSWDATACQVTCSVRLMSGARIFCTSVHGCMADDAKYIPVVVINMHAAASFCSILAVPCFEDSYHALTSCVLLFYSNTRF